MGNEGRLEYRHLKDLYKKSANNEQDSGASVKVYSGESKPVFNRCCRGRPHVAWIRVLHFIERLTRHFTMTPETKLGHWRI